MRTLFPRSRALVIALFAVAAGMAARSALWPLDGKIYDAGITNQKPRKPEDIVILGIDESLMQGRHAYLAPRDKLAKLIDSVSAAGPSVIVLDVWLDSMMEPKQDAPLREALRAAKKRGVPVLLSDVPLEGGASLTGVTARGSVLPYFAEAAAATGSSLFEPDRDGIVRSVTQSHQLAVLPLLAAQAIREPERVGKGLSPGPLHVFKHRLQVEDIPIDWLGPPGTVGISPAQKYLEMPMLCQMLTGKAVFIGATYARSYDLLSTPFDAADHRNRMYGVEVLANATATLAEGGRRRSHETIGAEVQTVLAVLVVSFLVAALALRGALPGIAAAAVAVAGSLALAFYSAQQVAPWLSSRFWPSAPFLISAVLACGIGIAWRQWEQAAELRLVRDAFGAYVGDEVLQKLGGKMPELGGEMRNIAVLFCDIRGYSALAESMQNDPARLMSELNAHFEPLVGALKKRGAYADNYVGDLVMALFGAPISAGSFRQDTEASVWAALDFVRLVEERNKLRREKGEPPIEVGIGLHCGEAVVGNLGTLGPQSKIHYTAIGDAVNIASRVESTTRKYDVPLLVTEEVVQATGDTFQWQFVDETTVKGRVAPVRLYKNV